jgi:hypothetical protein
VYPGELMAAITPMQNNTPLDFRLLALTLKHVGSVRMKNRKFLFARSDSS